MLIDKVPGPHVASECRELELGLNRASCSMRYTFALLGFAGSLVCCLHACAR